MHPANAYAIRRAIPTDGGELKRLAQLDSSPVPTGSILVGEIGGTIVAALSVADGKGVADPFVDTAALVLQMRLRARGLRAVRATPSLGERLSIALRPVTIPERA